MSLHDRLMLDPESIPVWMEKFDGDDDWCSMRDFFAARVVFYPGAGFDGQPVQLFARSNAAHTFLYADSGITHSALLAEINTRATRFAGYKIIGQRSLKASDDPQLNALFAAPGHLAPDCAPFAEVVVLERNAGLAEEHGAKRFALLYVCADALTVAKAFWVRGKFGAPWSVVLQDHGFGGNSGSFGEGGALTPILAHRTSVLLVAENTDAWAGFEPIPNIAGEPGGQHKHLRRLYRPVRAPGLSDKGPEHCT